MYFDREYESGALGRTVHSLSFKSLPFKNPLKVNTRNAFKFNGTNPSESTAMPKPRRERRKSSPVLTLPRVRFSSGKGLVGYGLAPREGWVNTCPGTRIASKAMFTLGARARLSLGTNVNTPFFRLENPPQNLGKMSVPEYKVETSYSGTKVGVYILGTQCLNTAPFCAVRRHRFFFQGPTPTPCPSTRSRPCTQALKWVFISWVPSV